MPARILGLSYHLPERTETNEQLAAENPDWDMKRAVRKLGISARHIAADGETASDLGLIAAQKLLGRNIVALDEIDYLIFTTESPDQFLPPSACQMQSRLGLGRHVGAFDMNLGCSGFIYALHLANSLVVSGGARNVLLVLADTYTKYIHPRDRTVRTLFGDGAAAALIGNGAEPGIGAFVLGTDGSGADSLIVPAGGMRMPKSAETAIAREDASGCTRGPENLFMDGPAIFAFANEIVPPMIDAVLDKARLTRDEMDWFVYHQANKFMLDRLAQLTDVPDGKMVLDVEHVGNTVSASVPIAIQTYADAGKIKPGQTLLLAGFGVGLSWGACVVTWG